MKTVFVLSKNHFPSGDASAIRFENLFSIFKACGYLNILVFEYGYNDYLKEIERESYKSICLRKKVFNKNCFISKIISKLFFEQRYIKELKKRIQKEDLVIIGGNFSLKTIRKVHKLSKSKSAKTVLSLTEKYSSFEFPFNGLFSIEYQINKKIYKSYKSSDPSILCISTFMESQFKKRNIKTSVIPFVFDADKFYNSQEIIDRTSDIQTSFLYCGKPTKKDLLIELLRAFLSLPNELIQQIKFNIVGVNEKWAKKQLSYSELQKMKSFVSFYGVKDRSFIKNIYESSHYSVLLRPFNEDYAKAGFPTKISESLFYGVPPITNLTSDLSFYLNSENSIIVDGETNESFLKALLNALEIFHDKKRYQNLRLNAKKTALEKLDSKLFIEQFANLINN